MRRFNFKSIGVMPGETIYFSLNPNIKAIVVNENYIEFEGKLMSTSGAALKILEEAGKKRVSVRGPSMWRYKGKLLSELAQIS